ncbi:MAG: flagellar basal body L-ring protein FlgH [Natronospirillum sp.]
MLAALGGIVWLVGCTSTGEIRLDERPDEAAFAPVPSTSMGPPQVTNGSIYAQGYGIQLFGDKNAHRVGDVITVLLEERTVSQKSTATNSNRESNVDLQTPQIGGGDLRILNNPLSANISGDRSFNGSGTANQSNRLEGSISVTVAEVLPNGVLRVRGEKWITLTRGEEYLRVSGMVRPEDINLDNTIQSSKLADARIAYSGTGELADSTRQGWLTRIFNSPLFPF